MFTDDLYKEIGSNAIEKSLRIREAFLSKGLRPFSESYTNQQIFYLPNRTLEALSHDVSFEVWGTPGKEETAVRFVTSWATTDCDVAALLKLIEAQ